MSCAQSPEDSEWICADLGANDIAVSSNGDLDAHQNTRFVHLAVDKSKQAAAGVPGRISVKGGTAKISYAAGFSCPAQVSAVATLSGAGAARQ